MTRSFWRVQINGISILAGCKDPGRQFETLRAHIAALRRNPYWTFSLVHVYVERNLGFEAEHHMRAFEGDKNVRFFVDQKAARVGILTTNEVKHAMSVITNMMLRERRVSIHQHHFTVVGPYTKENILSRFRDQLNIYSYSFKDGASLFSKQQVALTGKVGGCVDDICICFQLGLYFTQPNLAPPP